MSRVDAAVVISQTSQFHGKGQCDRLMVLIIRSRNDLLCHMRSEYRSCSRVTAVGKCHLVPPW